MNNGYIGNGYGGKKFNKSRIIIVFAVVILAITGVGFGFSYGIKKFKNSSSNSAGSVAANNGVKNNDAKGVIESAEYMAKGYDYDGAIALIQSQADYNSKQEYQEAVQKFQNEKAQCVPVDVTKVPHIFYHSLVNEPSRTFDVQKLGAAYANGHQTWMVTTQEFDNITKALYDNGYVYVRLRDLVVETKNADGTVTFEKNTNLLLPRDKKAVVLSIDDLSYYHTYEKGGYPNRLIVDENGKPKCEYTNSSGETSIGDYDVVPRLNTFLEEHPDGAYKNARGLIAMTGYNGVFGYRTDVAYKTGERLGSDQKAWLAAHPDFNWDTDVAEAKKVAQAIKDSGWEFASHTWGHISVTGKSAEDLKIDDQKWKNTVENIIGPVDTIIFAHGNDISNHKDYSADNQAFQYYKSSGYNYFCNVDASNLYWNQFRSNYIRQARINLDGLTLNRAISGKTKVLDNLFDANAVYDSRRPAFAAVAGKE